MDLGTLRKNPDGYEIRLERVYPHSIQSVWDALTNPASIARWFTDVEWDFRPGGRITFIFQDEDKTRSYGRIITIDAPRLLEYIWENEEGGPDELAHWELFEEGASTRLVLTYSRISESYAPNVATGWHSVVDDLGDFLNGRTDFEDFGSGAPNEEREALKGEYHKIFDELKKQ